MKHLLSTLILGFLMTFSIAQTNLDSLYGVWEDDSKVDSIRAKAFNDYIAKEFLYAQPDSALVLSDILYKFSSNKNFVRGMALALNLKAMGYYIKGEYKTAIQLHQDGLKIRVKIGDKKGIAGSHHNMGMVYRSQGNYIKSLNSYQYAIEGYEAVNNTIGSAKIYNNIGNIYGDLGDDDKALIYYEKSLQNYEEIENNEGIANTLNNIGIVHASKRNIEQAMNFYNKSLKIRKANNDKQGMAMSLNNIGNLYEDEENYINALEFYNECLDIVNEMNHTYGIAQSNLNIARIQIVSGQYGDAIKNCKNGLYSAQEMGTVELQKKACECLYEAYKAKGNGSKALEYHEQMLVLNDSLQSEETAKKLQQMEFAKQVMADSLEQVERELKTEMVHQAEVRKTDRNRNLALGAGFFFLVLSGGFYSRWRYVKKSKAVIEKEKDRSDNLLLNILPSEIAEELKEKGSADARDFELVSILFSDFKGFTQASEKLSAKELIHEINVCFKAFDLTCEKYGVEKIKTIGDAYMAAGGLPIPSKNSVRNTILAALDMQTFISERIKEKEARNEVPFKMRLGIHTGPVVAGIVGVKKFQYDIWGDTVNTASRMESSGEIGKVNISAATYTLVKDEPSFNFEARGHIMAKGKGEMKMYFVSSTV